MLLGVAGLSSCRVVGDVVNIDEWLIHTITVAPMTGRNAAGDPTFGPQVPVLARVESGKILSLNGALGNVLQATHVAVTKVPINVNDRVWLPGDSTADTSQARRPLSIRNAPIKNGSFTLYETYF